MDVSTPLVLVLVVCVLQASAQLTPYRQGAVILNDVCLAEDDLASRAADQDIADTLRGLASRLVNRTGKCAGTTQLALRCLQSLCAS